MGVDLILASASPRRRQLLLDAGLHVRVVPQFVDEEQYNSMPHAEIPALLARAKAMNYGHLEPTQVLLAADTLVFQEGQMLSKPQTPEEAIEMLQKLQGNQHTVITGVCIRMGQQVRSFSEETRVWFRTLGTKEIQDYVATGSPMDKAGAYGIQEPFGINAVTRIEGSYTNIVGLPMAQTLEVLQQLGLVLQKV